LIDYYLGRRRNKKLFLEKVPFIVLSIVFTLIAFSNSETHTYFTHSKLQSFNFIDIIFLNGRALFFYLQKLLIPVNLSAVYVFPVKSNFLLPIDYYIYSFFILIFFSILIKFRKNKNIILGAGLFLLTISINLPLISLRSVIFADRYAYFPFLGLFLIIGTSYQTFVEKYYDNYKKYIYAVFLLIVILGLILSVETWNVNKKWENDLTLTTDIINKNPEVPLIAKMYRKRGNYYFDHQMIVEAIKDYSKAIEINPYDIDSYVHRAFSYLKLNKLEEALPDLNKSIENKPTVSILYADRALVRLNIGDKIGAMSDCNMCLSLDSTKVEIYNCRAILRIQSGDLTGAETDLRTAIKYNRYYAEAYRNLGIVFFKMQDIEKASYYWEIASKLGDSDAKEFLNHSQVRK
jgi:tetratricopeptide (TPR) repeat protein